MSLNKSIILPKPIRSIWSFIRQWIKTWFFVLLLTITTWPVFIPLADWIFHPDDGGGLCVICGRELALFSLSLFFAHWFWVGLLSLKRFVKIWERILSIVLFFIAHYLFIFLDTSLLVSELPIIAICLPLGVLLYLAWQKYGQKIKDKDAFRKAIIIIKKIILILLIKGGVSLIGLAGGFFADRALNYLFYLIPVFIAYLLFKKFYTKKISYILTFLLVVGIINSSFIDFPFVIFGFIITGIMLVIAIYDGILVIKKQVKR